MLWIIASDFNQTLSSLEKIRTSNTLEARQITTVKWKLLKKSLEIDTSDLLTCVSSIKNPENRLYNLEEVSHFIDIAHLDQQQIYDEFIDILKIESVCDFFNLKYAADKLRLNIKTQYPIDSILQDMVQTLTQILPNVLQSISPQTLTAPNLLTIIFEIALSKRMLENPCSKKQFCFLQARQALTKAREDADHYNLWLRHALAYIKSFSQHSDENQGSISQNDILSLGTSFLDFFKDWLDKYHSDLISNSFDPARMPFVAPSDIFSLYIIKLPEEAIPKGYDILLAIPLTHDIQTLPLHRIGVLQSSTTLMVDTIRNRLPNKDLKTGYFLVDESTQRLIASLL